MSKKELTSGAHRITHELLKECVAVDIVPLRVKAYECNYCGKLFRSTFPKSYCSKECMSMQRKEWRNERLKGE